MWYRRSSCSTFNYPVLSISIRHYPKAPTAPQNKPLLQVRACRAWRASARLCAGSHRRGRGAKCRGMLEANSCLREPYNTTSVDLI